MAARVQRSVRQAGVWVGLLLVQCLLAPGVASASGVAEPQDIWTGDSDAPVPATLRGATVIDTPRLAKLLRDGMPGSTPAGAAPVLLDVSSAPREPAGLAPGAPWMPVPHRALPGAIWLPGAGAGNLSVPYLDFLRGQIGSATGGSLGVPVIVYCHEKCWLSWNAAKRTVDFGYRHVYWYSEGIEGWTAGRHPTVEAEARAPAVDAPGGAGVTDTVRLPKLVVLDIELSGDLGGPELVAEHELRLTAESLRLRADLQKSGRYAVVDVAPARATIDRLKAQQMYLHDCNGCDLDVGLELHAEQIMVAWVNRVSGLILTLTYEIHDVGTGQILARKSFDFRGDNESAWNHAVDYLVRHMQE